MADTTTSGRPPEPGPAAERPGEPSPRTEWPEPRPAVDLNIIRSGAIVLAVLGILALLHFAASVFITIFSALLLAFALEPVVHLLCVRTRLRRHHASGIVVFLFVAMIYGLLSLGYLGARNFLEDLPTIAQKIRSAPLVETLSKRAAEVDRLVTEAGRGISPPPGAPDSAGSALPVTVQEAE